MTSPPSSNAANAPSSSVALATKTSDFDFMKALLLKFSLYYSKAKSFIYDALILRMTEKWYRAVLSRLENGSVLLDVGIGTGGALLRCIDLIESKDLKVVGIDIDSAYVEAGRISVQNAGLSNRISIDKVDLYEGHEKMMELAKNMGVAADADGKLFDAVYFSGSFSLLPDHAKALKLVADVVKNKGRNKEGENNEQGTIYITQTYQRKTPFFLPYVKPLLKYATTIDFGNLVREEEVLQTFRESGLGVVEHGVIPESVDNAFQAAYLSVLR